jgi:hypothetical protein
VAATIGNQTPGSHPSGVTARLTPGALFDGWWEHGTVTCMDERELFRIAATQLSDVSGEWLLRRESGLWTMLRREPFTSGGDLQVLLGNGETLIDLAGKLAEHPPSDIGPVGFSPEKFDLTFADLTDDDALALAAPCAFCTLRGTQQTHTLVGPGLECQTLWIDPADIPVLRRPCRRHEACFRYSVAPALPLLLAAHANGWTPDTHLPMADTFAGWEGLRQQFTISCDITGGRPDANALVTAVCDSLEEIPGAHHCQCGRPSGLSVTLVARGEPEERVRQLHDHLETLGGRLYAVPAGLSFTYAGWDVVAAIGEDLTLLGRSWELDEALDAAWHNVGLLSPGR